MWENVGTAVRSVRTEGGYIEKIAQIPFPESKYPLNKPHLTTKGSLPIRLAGGSHSPSKLHLGLE